MTDVALNGEQTRALTTSLSTHLQAHGIEESLAGCISCKVVLGVSIGAAVVTCIALSEGACVVAIADATGLSEGVVIGILAGGGGGAEAVIEDLCKAMKAC